jgi:hypothetical protein
MRDLQLHHTRSTVQADVATPTTECPIVESVRAAGMLCGPILDVNVAARRLLGEPSVALYGAAGAGFSDYHTTINAPLAFFLSDYEGINLPQCLESTARLLRNSSIEEITKEWPAMSYKFSKFAAGFSNYGAIEFQPCLARAMAIELLACGVREIQVSCQGDTPLIQYSLAGKDFSIFFLQEDLLSFNCERLSAQGLAVDVYYHRAAMEIPSTYSCEGRELFRSLFQQMPTGGAFVTDDIAASSHPPMAWDCSDQFPSSFDGVSGRLQEHELPISVRRRLIEQRSYNDSTLYGSYLRVRKKVLEE